MTVVIAPVHALHLELIRDEGLWEVLETWKRDLARAVQAAGDGAVQLWDFATYHRYAREPVPLDPAAREPMRWFWESSHFTRELGGLMARRFLGVATDDPLPPDYGVPLTVETVESHLASVREGHRQFQQDHPEQIAFMRESIGRGQPAAAGPRSVTP